MKKQDHKKIYLKKNIQLNFKIFFINSVEYLIIKIRKGRDNINEKASISKL